MSKTILHFIPGLQKYGKNWAKASKEVITKSSTQCKHYYQNHRKRLGLDNLLKQSTSDSIVSYYTVEHNVKYSAHPATTFLLPHSQSIIEPHII